MSAAICFMAREQVVTAGLAPLEDSNLQLTRVNCSPKKYPWPITTGPVKLGLGESMAAVCRVPVEGTAAYATQRVLCYLDCVRRKLVTDVTKRRPHATQAV
jgi:hypothetical protein